MGRILMKLDKNYKHLLEPILRSILINFFEKNKQVNMDSQAARNKLAKHIVDAIPTPLLASINFIKPSSDEDDEFMTLL